MRAKCWNRAAEPHFNDVFALSHGNNAGKPLREPCPNCFVIRAKDTAEKELLFSLLTALWLGRCFTVHIGGSVIPFLKIRDFQQVLNEGLARARDNPERFKEIAAQVKTAIDLEEAVKKNSSCVSN